MLKTIITIQGTHCASCKALIEEACMENPCVLSCSVDYAKGKAELEYEECLDWQNLKDEIEGLGPYKIIDIPR